jgi:hypothetical protein
MLKDHCHDVTDVKFHEVVQGMPEVRNVWFYQDRTCPFMTYAHLAPQHTQARQDPTIGTAMGLSALQACH